MRNYYIYLFDGRGHLDRAHKVQCRDDLAALAAGEKLASENAVEVWDGGRMVAREV